MLTKSIVIDLGLSQLYEESSQTVQKAYEMEMPDYIHTKSPLLHFFPYVSDEADILLKQMQMR